MAPSDLLRPKTVPAAGTAIIVVRPSPIGSIIRAASGVSAMAIVGQLTLLAAIPVLARLYSPADFGVFTIYLS
ncbi:MAG: lipopolysaccharide biosynthesis protein, partial [Mesorhizobium sp.]